MAASDPNTATNAAADAASSFDTADAHTLVLPTLRPEDEVHPPGEAAPSADDTGAQAVVQRVLAWHNRHRLARPIRAEQVQSVGVVALPFVPQGKKGPQPAFDERFADALSLRTLRRFAARHAAAQRPGNPAWPQRDVGLGAKVAADAPEQRYLITAAIEQGDRRLRLLLAPGDTGPVIGPRSWRWPPKLMAAGAGAMALVLAGVVGSLVWWLQPAAHPTTHPTTHPAAASAASAASAAPAALAHAKTPHLAASASASASASAPAALPPLAAAASAASAPGEVADLAPVLPPAPVAAAASTDLHSRTAPRIAPRALADAAAAATPRPNDHPLDLFALASRPAPTRAMAEHDLNSLRDLISLEPHATATHLEVMPLQGRWLVVWWPFVSRAQAEHARAQWQAVVPAVASQGWQVMNF